MTIQSIWLYGMILLLSWLLIWFTSRIRVVANGYNFRWMASFSVGKRTNKNLLFWFVLENFIFGVKYIRYAFVAFLVLFAASELGIIWYAWQQITLTRRKSCSSWFRGLNKMTPILQAAFQTHFLIIILRFKFRWSLFLMIQSTICQHWSPGLGMAPNRGPFY